MRRICGDNIICGDGIEQIDFNKLIRLNDTAAFLWNAVEGIEFTVQTLADALVSEYEIDMDLALRDSQSLLDSWKENGLVEE